jgi:hypothetical protein
MYVDVIVKVKSISLISEKQIVNLESEFKFYKFLSKATCHSLTPRNTAHTNKRNEKNIQLIKIYKLHWNIIQCAKYLNNVTPQNIVLLRQLTVVLENNNNNNNTVRLEVMLK